jgi:PX domain
LLGTGHYTYKIKSKKKTEVDHVEVHRRYSEFDDLQKVLAMRFPGVICPFLPEKDIRNKLFDKESQKVQERL